MMPSPSPFAEPPRPRLPPDAKRTIRRIARACGARHVRVFGSVARGDEGPGSDLDLLVHLPAGSSLLDLARLKVELEGALRRRVDVVPDDSIKPPLRARILADARPL